MKADRFSQPCEGAVVKERWLQGYVPQGRCPEFITITSIGSDLLQPEVLVFAATIKNYVALAHTKSRSNLRYPGHVHPKITEHLVRRPGNRVTGDAPGFPEEQKCSSLFPNRERIRFASRESIYRRVGKHQGELEFGNCLREHHRFDPAPRGYGRKRRPEELPVCFDSVQTLEDSLANRFVPEARFVGGRHNLPLPVVEQVEAGTDCARSTCEPCYLDHFRRGQVSLCNQQMPDR